MERSTKRAFFYSHKRKDVVKYREKFLDKMKALLYYFVEFNEDESILFKE